MDKGVIESLRTDCLKLIQCRYFYLPLIRVNALFSLKGGLFRAEVFVKVPPPFLIFSTSFLILKVY